MKKINFFILLSLANYSYSESGKTTQEKKELKSLVEFGAVYKHYKGNNYKVITSAHNSENPDEVFVIYQALYDSPGFGKNSVWARLIKMFVENVTINGIEQPRFKKTSESGVTIMQEKNEIKSVVLIGSTYEHYSGKKYKIISLAHHSENPEEVFVVYEGLYDCPSFGKNPVWARPIKMFTENVTINGKEQPRFKKLD